VVISAGAHYTDADAIAAVEAEPILNLSGDLGIGTAVPGARLHITNTTIGDIQPAVLIDRPSSVDYEAGQWWGTGGAPGWFLGLDNDGTEDMGFWHNGPNWVLTMQDATGNVGVGKRTAAAKLDVAGKISADGAIASQGNYVQRDVLTYGTVAGSNTPIHIKTNIPIQQNIMFRLLVEGYNYGAAQDINSATVGYPYALTACTINVQNINYASGVSISHYCSSDGFIVVKLTNPTSLYYAGFTMSAFMLNPTGRGFEVTGQVFQQVADL